MNAAASGTGAAPIDVVLTMTDEYGKKVREIALLQCRCDTGADLETDRPKRAEAQEQQAA